MALSPELKDAVNYADAHAHGYRAYLTIVDELKRVGGLEQLASEADAAVAAKRRDVLAAEAELDKAKVKLTKAEDAIAAAKEDADDIVAQAQGRADTIIEQAEAKAKSITGKAETTAVDVKRKADAELADVQADIAASKGERDRLDAAIAERTATVADLEKRAKTAQDYLNKLAGKAAQMN